jgi:hypothetical protein
VPAWQRRLFLTGVKKRQQHPIMTRQLIDRDISNGKLNQGAEVLTKHMPLVVRNSRTGIIRLSVKLYMFVCVHGIKYLWRTTVAHYTRYKPHGHAVVSAISYSWIEYLLLPFGQRKPNLPPALLRPCCSSSTTCTTSLLSTRWWHCIPCVEITGAMV